MSVSALVVTPGAANANAYVSLAVADQYHADRPASGTTWEDATSDEKNAAILFATEQLDMLYAWTGYVVNSTQALLWPRVGMWYPSRYTVPSDIIPIQLQRATAEFARQLLAADRTADSDVETQGISSLSVGPVSLSFKSTVKAKVIPDAVFNLLPRDWGFPRGRVGNTMDLARV